MSSKGASIYLEITVPIRFIVCLVGNGSTQLNTSLLQNGISISSTVSRGRTERSRSSICSDSPHLAQPARLTMRANSSIRGITARTKH